MSALLRNQPTSTKTQFYEFSLMWQSYIDEFLTTTINIILSIFALSSVKPRSSLLRNAITATWIIEIYFVIIYVCMHRLYGNGFINIILTSLGISAHLVVVLEKYYKTTDRQHIMDTLRKTNTKWQQLMSTNQYRRKIHWKITMPLIFILVVSTGCQLLIMWAVFQLFDTNQRMLSWLLLPSVIAMKLSIIDFLAIVTALNTFIKPMRQLLDDLGERNLQLVFPETNLMKLRRADSRLIAVQPNSSDAEVEQLLTQCKELYTDFYALFNMINGSYGWSLLVFSAVYFTYFVCNLFGIVEVIVTHQEKSTFRLLHNFGYVMLAVVLLGSICWHCQQCYNESLRIGGLVFKLVKPMGNKRYSDLVLNFSLQTLHQHFVITAQNFFSLNLNLLGGMIAAIVTYLVILIQFSFTESKPNMTIIANVTKVMQRP